MFSFYFFFFFNESATQRYIDRRSPSTSPLVSFFDSPQLPVSSRNRADWKAGELLIKNFRKVWIYLTRFRVCLGTSGKADPFTTGSCRKFKPEVMVVLVHKDTVLSKGVFERGTPIKSGFFALMSKFIKRKYGRRTNEVASHDGTLKKKGLTSG